MNLTKYLKQRDFEKAYQALEAQCFDYSLSNIERIFPNCDTVLLYSFLMYSVSKKDTAQKHLLICECLIYGEPYIYECTSMIYWHINHALTITKQPEKIMGWVIEVYGADPSSPFFFFLIVFFAKNVLTKNPNNKVAFNILNPATKN